MQGGAFNDAVEEPFATGTGLILVEAFIGKGGYLGAESEEVVAEASLADLFIIGWESRRIGGGGGGGGAVF